MNNYKSTAKTGISKKFRQLFHQDAAKAFFDRIASMEPKRFYKSWIGINFYADNLLSLKLYYTFYENLEHSRLSCIFQEKSIISDFLTTMRDASQEHVFEPSLPGSGYTVCIKLDGENEPTYGYFHRVRENRMGIFRLYRGEQSQTKYYYYIDSPTERLELASRCGRPILADCETIECGKGPGHGIYPVEDHTKFNLIGNFPGIRPRLYEPTELKAISALEEEFGFAAVCGGFYGDIAKSVYFVAPKPDGRGHITTIERLQGAKTIRHPVRNTRPPTNPGA